MLETEGLVSIDDEYTSLAGFLLARFESMPEPGQEIAIDGLRYRILAVEERRIAKVLVQRIAPDTDEQVA